MDLITLADLPELAGTDPKPRVTIAIGRLDDNLRDPRYGRFAITQRQVDGWKRNLSDTFGGQVAIDFDHSSDRGQGTRAAAWIRSIDQQGKLITADVEFSKRGARAVRNGDYKYTSPTFVENYTDEHGEKHGPALIGAALTNRPVLRKGMPCLSLSKDRFDDVAVLQAAASPVSPSRVPGNPTSSRPTKKGRTAGNPKRKKGKGKSAPARDSRPQMSKLSKIALSLNLDAEADEATVLAAIDEKMAGADAAQAKADKKARKLAKKAKTSETLTLSSMNDERFAQLLLDANAGASAAAQLAEDRFETAWQKALDEGRAAPSQEENLRELHKANADLAIKTLAAFVPIVPTKPTGSGQGPAGAAPNGMDDDRFALHQMAKALAHEKRQADPKLDESEAYSLAVLEIEDRKFTLENPGI